MTAHNIVQSHNSMVAIQLLHSVIAHRCHDFASKCEIKYYLNYA